jgi:succinate-acetate transporter protein
MAKRMDERFKRSDARVILRPLGNPLPAAFFALAVGTFTLSAMQLGWVPTSESKDVALVLIAFVFPLQFVSAVLAFLARDGSIGTGIGLVAGGWLVVGLATLTSPPGSTGNALGVFLLALALQLVAPVFAALPAKTVAAAVVAGTAFRFAVTAIYELSGSGAWQNVAGSVGLGLFALALFGGFAFELSDARQGSGPLPIGRAEGGRPVGSDPTEHLDREPGVRPLL